jgi:hypothetical protein
LESGTRAKVIGIFDPDHILSPYPITFKVESPRIIHHARLTDLSPVAELELV